MFSFYLAFTEARFLHVVVFAERINVLEKNAVREEVVFSMNERLKVCDGNTTSSFL
jgi:hypothetical protein